MPDISQTSPELQRFLALANSGIQAEEDMAAYELAQAALDNATFLDESALRGFVVFMSIAKLDPDQAAALLEDE